MRYSKACIALASHALMPDPNTALYDETTQITDLQPLYLFISTEVLVRIFLSYYTSGQTTIENTWILLLFLCLIVSLSRNTKQFKKRRTSTERP